MELKKINESVSYIPNPSNIGVIQKGSECILIDTGLDSETGKKILKVLGQNQLRVKAIINTHAHADHFGGNKIIKEQTNCLTYAPKIEAGIIENPILEPLTLFSGANPINELKNKFLMAQPCKVDHIIEENELKIGDFLLKFVPLPGHSINQTGIVFEETLFCADSFFSEETIQKHKIPFFTDIEETKKTLNFLKETKYKIYIPSHLKPQTNPINIIDKNLQAIEEINTAILEILEEEKGTEQALKLLCDKMEIKIGTVQQYHLLKTVLLAHLEYLYNSQIDIKTEKNMLTWKKSQTV